MLKRWKEIARTLKRDVKVVYFACRDPRMPWYARLLALAVVGYVLSPIDLIPDFIPVVGYLDDLVLAPLGIFLVLRMIPPQVLADARQRAESATATGRHRWAAAVIVLLWLSGAVLAGVWMWRWRMFGTRGAGGTR